MLDSNANPRSTAADHGAGGAVAELAETAAAASSTANVSPTATASPAANVAAITDLLGSPTTEAGADAPRWTALWLRRLRRLAVIGLMAAGLAAAWPWARLQLGAREAAVPGAGLPVHVVERGDLTISVTEDGSLVSAENIDIVCNVAGGTTIVWIIDDGARVTEGMELVRLDSSMLSENVTAQRIALEKARAAKIQAEKDYDAAVIAVEEYIEGTYKKDIRKAESDLTAATERLQATRNALDHGQRMFRKGYITPQQLEAQQSAVARAELDLGTAEIARDVLERFTRPKMITELESVRDAAKARRDSELAALELEQTKLERLTTQLERCLITAPKDGLVIYANSRNRDRETEIKNGAKVSEGKTILQLPNLAKMRVDVEVHEAKVDRIRPGMPAHIRVQGREFPGTVTAVGNRPQVNWYSTTKKYLVEVDIDDMTEELRPGFTAEVEIIVADLEDVIALPVAAVVEQAGGYFCAVRTADGFDRRRVTVGQGNDKLVEVTSGLETGEEVFMTPRKLFGEAPDREGTSRSGGRPPRRQSEAP
jgi:HlyD family secretion protein